MQGVLLAAGKGKRLQPLTLSRSKAMAPVAGKPLAARVAEILVAQAISELIVVVGANDDEVQPYFRHEANLGIPVRFVVQEERKGMAHALGLAAPLIHGDFIMSACDNLVPVAHLQEMVAYHRQLSAVATLSLMPIELTDAGKTGVVVWESPYVRRIVEKPKPEEAPSNISSLPLYFFAPDILELLPLVKPSLRGEYELQDAIQLLIERSERVIGVLTHKRQQVTNAADLLTLNMHYLAQAPTQICCNATIPTSVTLNPPLVIEAGAMIGEGSVIGPRAYVERGAQIGAKARVQESIVLRGAEVISGQEVRGEVVVPLAEAGSSTTFKSQERQ